MIKNIKIIALALLLISFGVATGLTDFSGSISKVQSFPSTVCPGNRFDGVLTDLLPNAETPVTSIPSHKNKLVKSGTSNFLTKSALLVDGGQFTSTTLLRGSNGWLGGAVCSISDGDDWFVGGSAGVQSTGIISVINSGLSTAQVDFKIYSSKAPGLVSKSIPANSELDIPIDSLAPGEESIAVNALTRSGRVSIFMIDKRHNGLRDLGGDFVSPSAQPAKEIVIPNIPYFTKNMTQTLRIVVPGNVDANLKATIYSGDGSFAPSGVDGISITNSTSKDVPLSPVISDSSYSLKLSADVPIIASVLTKISSDIVWSTAAQLLTQTNLDIGGFKPLMRFYGPSISLNLNWVDVNGKHGGVHISGADSVAYRPKVALLRLQVTPAAQDNYGAMIIDNNSGFTAIPITPGSHLESSALPVSDAKAINRG
jgi:hypothetical protein